MDSLLLYIFYFFVVFLFYAPCLWAKYSRQAERHPTITYLLTTPYSFYLVYKHSEFIHEGNFPLIGESDSLFLKILSAAMILAYIHIFIPSRPKKKTWVSAGKLPALVFSDRGPRLAIAKRQYLSQKIATS